MHVSLDRNAVADPQQCQSVRSPRQWEDYGVLLVLVLCCGLSLLVFSSALLCGTRALILAATGFFLLSFWRPVSALLLVAFLLPVFGNRPGSEQMWVGIVCFSSLCLGASPRALHALWRGAQQSPRDLLVQLALLYTLVSFLSLVSLPWGELLLEARSFLSTNHPTDLFVHVYTFLRLDESKLAYSIASVLLTVQALSVGLLLYLSMQSDRALPLKYACALLLSLTVVLFLGVGDYYGLLSLAPIRSLDPVVNPGNIQFRMQSVFGHSGWFAEYLTLAIPFVMVVLIFPFTWRIKMALVLGLLVLGEFCLVLSYQRGGWISYPLTLLCVWCSLYVVDAMQRGEMSAFGGKNIGVARIIKGSLRKIALCLPLTLAITMGLVAVFGAGKGPEIISTYGERFADIAKVADRWDFIYVGFLFALLHPILGAGSESFAWQYEREVAAIDGRYHGIVDLPLHGSAHNVYMQVFAGKGLVGLVLLLMLLGVLIWYGIRAAREADRDTFSQRLLLVIGACFACAFAIYGNVQEVFYVHSLQVLFFIVIFIAASAASSIGLRHSLSGRITFALLSIVFLAHLAWEAVDDRLALASGGNFEYGCYGLEHDELGRPFRWCRYRARINRPVLTGRGGRYAEVTIATTLISQSEGVERISFMCGGREVESLMIRPLRYYSIRVPLPEEEGCVDESGIVALRLITGNGFSPFFDMGGQRDFRVVSYKLYQ